MWMAKPSFQRGEVGGRERGKHQMKDWGSPGTWPRSVFRTKGRSNIDMIQKHECLSWDNCCTSVWWWFSHLWTISDPITLLGTTPPTKCWLSFRLPEKYCFNKDLILSSREGVTQNGQVQMLDLQTISWHSGAWDGVGVLTLAPSYL